MKQLENLGFTSQRIFENTKDSATKYSGLIKEYTIYISIPDYQPNVAITTIFKGEKYLFGDILDIEILIQGLQAMCNEG